MVQDITPNTGSAVTNTNTMSPKTLSPQSAGSTTPTIISQSNADRRRKAAAEKAAKRRENLASNVAKAELEREYKRLRDAEEAANKRAEERKAAAKREKVTFYSGGVNSPLKIDRVSIGDYLGDQLRGAQAPAVDPTEFNQFQAMGNQGDTLDYDAAYAGLEKLAGSVNKQLEQEAKEKRLMDNVRTFAISTGSSMIGQGSSYTPLTVEARAAHLNLIENPTIDSDTRQRLIEDIRRDDANKGYVTEGDQTKLMNIALSSTAPKDAKQFAFNYLGEIGSTVGKADFNKSADAIYVSQYNKNNQAFLDRSRGSVYDIQPDTSSTRAIEENRTVKTELQAKDKSSDLDAKTRAAIAANQSGGTEALDTLRKARLNALEAGDVGVTGYVVEDENDPNFGKFRPDKNGNLVQYSVDPEEERQREANERLFARQNAEVQAQLNNNPNYVESILKVSDGNKLDLSSDAFFREQAATEREYGNTDWTSAGGETANRAMMEGRDSSSYSRFKAAPDTATDEYILISRDGKQRYTLRTSDRGGRFAIYGWAGDIVASGDTAEGLPSALKKLDVPFNEETFNPYVPDADDTRVMLDDETDLGDMEDTPAMFKSKQLGTYRTNDEIREAEFDRRDTLASRNSGGFNDYFDGIKELGDSIDESLAKYDEEYHKTLDELAPPVDKSAMARQQRFEGYTDKDQEGFLSTVNRMRAEAGLGESGIGESADIGGFGGADTGNLFSRNAGAARADFSGADSYGGYAGGNIDDEDFDEGDYDEGEFADADGEGEDFAEEIPEGDDFGEKPVESFGGKNLFGGAFGKTPKDFGDNVEFTSKTDIDESSEPFADFESTPAPSVKPTFTETGSPFMSAAQTSRDMFALKDKDLSSVPKYTERDHTPKERTKTIFDQMNLDKELGDIYSRIGLLSEGGTDDSGRAVAGLYPSTKKYAETVDELVGSGALIADGNKRETLYSDAENPDKNIDAYTNLRWSSRATPDAIERFKQVETDMNKASEDLNVEYKKLTEKYAEKEKLDKEVYEGIPHAAKETVHSLLPKPESVKPVVNTFEYLNPFISFGRMSQDSLWGNIDRAFGKEPKNKKPLEYWNDKIFNSTPVVYNVWDYDDFYTDPARYAFNYAEAYALFGGLGMGMREAGKRAPWVYHTVVDPLKDSKLAKKSKNYLEDLAKGNLPELPVTLQYTVTSLPGGTAKSLSAVRHMNGIDVAHPLISTLSGAKSGNGVYLGKAAFPQDTFLINATTGKPVEATIPRNPIEWAYVKATAEKINKDMTSVERANNIQNILIALKHSDPIVMQKITPHVESVLKSFKINNRRIFRKPKQVANAIVRVMNEFKAHSQSSLTQYATGRELGGAGLNRTPQDFDVFVGDVKKFNDSLAKVVNKIEGREVVYVKKGKIYLKANDQEFFDTHKKGEFGSEGIYSALGSIADEMHYIPGTNITTTTAQHQLENKLGALFNYTYPKILAKYPEIYGQGKPGVGWLMPRKEERGKDFEDSAFLLWDIAEQMASSKNPETVEWGKKIIPEIEAFLRSYGDEAYDKVRKDYEKFKKLNGGKTIQFTGQIIPVSKYGMNSSTKQGISALNKVGKKFKNNPNVSSFIKWARENINTDTLIGVPLGVYLTANYVSSVAARIASQEANPQDIISQEIIPMLAGAKYGAKHLNKFYEWTAFRNRSRYIPLNILVTEDVLTGKSEYPMWKYIRNDQKNHEAFMENFSKGGVANKRMEEEGLYPLNDVKTYAIRVTSQPYDEVRKGIGEVRATKYNENKNIASSSAASSGSIHFARIKGLLKKKNKYSVNLIPATYKPPQITNIMSTLELGDVPFGMGIKETEEFVLKNIRPDQFQSISAKSAKPRDSIYAEEEITARKGLRYETLDDTAFTYIDGKPVAVNTVGVIPMGMKHTDTKIKVVNKGYDPSKDPYNGLNQDPTANTQQTNPKTTKPTQKTKTTPNVSQKTSGFTPHKTPVFTFPKITTPTPLQSSIFTPPKTSVFTPPQTSKSTTLKLDETDNILADIIDAGFRKDKTAKTEAKQRFRDIISEDIRDNIEIPVISPKTGEFDMTMADIIDLGFKKDKTGKAKANQIFNDRIIEDIRKDNVGSVKTPKRNNSDKTIEDIIEARLNKNKAAESKARQEFRNAINQEIKEDVVKSVKMPKADKTDMAMVDIIDAGFRKDKTAKTEAKQRYKDYISEAIRDNVEGSDKFDDIMADIIEARLNKNKAAESKARQEFRNAINQEIKEDVVKSVKMPKMDKTDLAMADIIEARLNKNKAAESKARQEFRNAINQEIKEDVVKSVKMPKMDKTDLAMADIIEARLNKNKAAESKARQEFRNAINQEIKEDVVKSVKMPKADKTDMAMADIIEARLNKNKAAESKARQEFRNAINQEIKEDVVKSVKMPKMDKTDFAMADIIEARLNKNKSAESKAKQEFRNTINQEIKEDVAKTSNTVKNEPSITKITERIHAKIKTNTQAITDTKKRFKSNINTLKRTTRNNLTQKMGFTKGSHKITKESKEKIGYNYTYTPPDYVTRTEYGNPFTASPLYSSKPEEKSKESPKNPFGFDYKLPDFFSPSSPSYGEISSKLSTKNTSKFTSMPSITTRTSTVSTPPTKTPPTKSPPTKTPPTKSPPTKNPPTKSPPTKSPPTKTPPTKSPPTKSPPTKSPPTKSPPTKSPPTKSPPTKTPPTKSPPTKSPPTKSPPTKTPPTKIPPPTKTPPQRKRRPVRIPEDNPSDRKRLEGYNIFNLENTEIPIVRGFEALTGIETPTLELPANKQTFYQFGNTITKRKPNSKKKLKNPFDVSIDFKF